MTRYLISFDDGWMTFPEEDLPDVSRAAHDVVSEAMAQGVWVTGGGLHTQQATIATPAGSVLLGEFPETKAVIGGFSILDLQSHDEAIEWAKKIAKASRCNQEVREILADREV